MQGLLKEYKLEFEAFKVQLTNTPKNYYERVKILNAINLKVVFITWLVNLDEEDVDFISEIISWLNELHGSLIIESVDITHPDIEDYKCCIDEIKESAEDLHSVFFALPKLDDFKEAEDKIKHMKVNEGKEDIKTTSNWYSEKEMYDHLKRLDYSDEIALELCADYAKNLQLAMEKGVDRAIDKIELGEKFSIRKISLDAERIFPKDRISQLAFIKACTLMKPDIVYELKQIK